ncbi:hypothetical protein, partial [Escherichia coli]|uniref:hypothetical protein n=1 Tax=Escherichia coli TaxID=562 RepID=UPI001EDB8DA8
ELLEMDKDYRDVLSTVAALGSSIDAFKVQRYAIWVAMFSLVVALLTMGISLVANDDIMSTLCAFRLSEAIKDTKICGAL